MKITRDNFIKYFKKGKESALEYVIEQYAGIVKAVVYNALKSYQDLHVIEECISDTFIGAYENAKQFEGNEEDFRKWLRMPNPNLSNESPLAWLKAKRWRQLTDFVDDMLTGAQREQSEPY